LRPEDVGRYAHEVILLAWKRELKARLEDVGDLLAKGDPADLLVALRHGPKIADDVARIIAEVRHSWNCQTSTVTPTESRELLSLFALAPP